MQITFDTKNLSKKSKNYHFFVFHPISKMDLGLALRNFISHAFDIVIIPNVIL